MERDTSVAAFDLSRLNLGDYPSAKIKLDQLFFQFLSTQGQEIISDVIRQRHQHQHQTGTGQQQQQQQQQPPLSPPGKKSPKKRTQAEMLNISQKDRNNNNNNSSSKGHNNTPDAAALNHAASSSKGSSSDNGNSSLLEQLRGSLLGSPGASQASSSSSSATNNSQDKSPDDHVATSRRRSNVDTIPAFYVKTAGKSRGTHRLIAESLKAGNSNNLSTVAGLGGLTTATLSADLTDGAGDLVSRLPEIEAFFKPFKDGISIDKFVHVTKRLCGLPSYFNLPLCVRILEQFGGAGRLPTYKFGYRPNIQAKITIKIFMQFWQAEMEPFDRIERFYRLIKQPNAQYIFRDDFMPYMQELLRFHPGLDFLDSHEEFQRKYALTVITRIFYKVNTSRSGKLSLRELRRSNLLQEFMHVDEEADINRVTEYFSYEHFYVLYCRFFELDTDKDSLLNRETLMKYGDHALSETIVDRIFRVSPRSYTDGQEGGLDKTGGMNFTDFVFFMISEEDKTSEQALRYWFSCADLDGDGVLTPAEMRHFYKAQILRLTSMGQESIQFQDVLCQMIDMISPRDDTQITLRDLLQPDKRRISGVLFDVLFNLHKFLRFEMRDPFQEKLRREDGFQCEWDRFAHFEYHRLSYEEEHGAAGGNGNGGGAMNGQVGNGSFGGGHMSQGGHDDDDDDDDMFGDDLDDDTVHPSAYPGGGVQGGGGHITATGSGGGGVPGRLGGGMDLDSSEDHWSLDDDSDDDSNFVSSNGGTGNGTGTGRASAAGSSSTGTTGNRGGSYKSVGSNVSVGSKGKGSNSTGSGNNGSNGNGGNNIRRKPTGGSGSSSAASASARKLR